MEVYINGKRILLNPKDLIGEGGEAKVYLSGGLAIKVYHPNFVSSRREQKLRAFPKKLPPKLVGPIDLVEDKKSQVIGFSMKALPGAEAFISLSNKKFRENFANEKVVRIFLDTLETLKQIHSPAYSNAIVGDLNDLNLLFRDEEAYFIDADSIQFSNFPCEVATEQFLDPRLYGIDFSRKPAFSNDSDWYSFCVLLFRSLLLVGPYGGVHKNYPNHLRRAESRISVFNPDVVYPKAAIPFKVLDDALLEYFKKVFEKDLRGEFPKPLLENLRWTKCNACGATHGRNTCPFCFQMAPAAIKAVEMFNKKCLVTIVFRTKGRIICAKAEFGKLRYVFEENGAVKRENGTKVMLQNPDNFTRFSILGEKTFIAYGKKILIVENEKIIKESSTGMLGNLSVLETSETDYFRLQGDLLIRNEKNIISNILENQTWIRVGPKFGFGFYRIGNKTVYFIFSTQGSGVNDSIQLPKIEGQLVDAQAIFSETHVLFLTSVMASGKLINSMYLLNAKGQLIASLSEDADNSRILSSIHNKVLGGDKIITSDDEGLILLEAAQNQIREVKIFTDTEPFVDDKVQLLAGGGGIYVVAGQVIKLLKLT